VQGQDFLLAERILKTIDDLAEAKKARVPSDSESDGRSSLCEDSGMPNHSEEAAAGGAAPAAPAVSKAAAKAAQYEMQVAELKEQIQAAVQEKDFKDAARLKNEIDELQRKLDEAQRKATKVQEALEAAVQGQDFLRAERLQQIMDDLAEGKEAPPGALLAAAMKGDRQAPTDEELKKKKEAFEKKLRKQLEDVKDPRTRQTKLLQVRQMLTEKADHLSKAAGLTPEDIKTLMEMLDREFSIKAKPAQPKGPPPRNLLSRRAGDGVPGGNAAPSTPPDSSRPPEAGKSALKRRTHPGRFKAGRTPRISWPQEIKSTSSVVSFRSMGEQLWFHMPGSYVSCDTCNKSVPQSCGALQGEPQRPQFAQDQFLCSECMNRGMSGHGLNMGYGQ